MSKEITVWIIDDDQVNNLICKTMLNEESWVSEVFEFTDSKKAFAELKALSEENFPDALLLDINMPGFSGWQFLDRAKTEIRFFEGEKTPCVILLTSSIDESDELQATENPLVEGMLSKPLDINRMKEICFPRD